jgi:hypothetical protein
MKTFNHVVVVILTLCLLFTVNSFAQKKTIITVGGSWWNAGYTWEDNSGNELFKVDPGNNFGPYLSVTSGKWNIGASYLSGKYPIKELDFGGQILNVDVDMTRGDLNLSVGYRVHPMINIFAGMKHLKWSMEMKLTDSWYINESYSEKYTYSGPLFGGGASIVVPFGTSGLYGFGSLAALGGTIVYSYDGYDTVLMQNISAETDLSAALIALNAGVGYRFSSGLGVNAGYRGDYISTQLADGTSDSKENLRVQGFILTLSYSFK